jgi:hypothetical protein
MLVVSTLLSVAAAGVGLRLLGGGGAIHPVPLLTNLALVVGAPMAAGIAIRTKLTLSDRQEAAAERLSVAVVTLLVWLVASQVRLSSSYIAVAAALLLFLAGSAILGTALGLRAPAPVATALLLTTSMRDFAIAAGIAVAAFGAASAAPLGLYGVMVIGWGMAIATLRSARPYRSSPTTSLPLDATAAVIPSHTDPHADSYAEVTTLLRSLAECLNTIPGPGAASTRQGQPPEPPTSPATSTTIAEADLSGILTVLRPGGPRLISFVARAAVDVLSSMPLSAPPTLEPVTLGVILHTPSGLSFGVVDHANEFRLRALDQALTAPNDKPHPDVASVPLWLSDNSSQGVSTAVAVPDTAVLSIGAIRREPRIIQTTAGEAISARTVVTLTLSYPTALVNHGATVDFLHHVINTIQTRDWSTEL